MSRLEAMIQAGEAEPVTWHDPVLLDQADTPHCVGYGFAGFWATAQRVIGPNPAVTNSDGESIYYAAKIYDGEPGAENGSCLRSGAKVLKDRGIIAAYAFGTFDEAAHWVTNYGPVVLGTNWYERMFTPSWHFGILYPRGEIVGGHCYLWRGVHRRLGFWRYNMVRNSWGQWGKGGDAYLSDKNLRRLMYEDGEACMMVRLK
jgi:hypothetical protein